MFIFGEAVAHAGQVAADVFAVCLILLAAVGIDHGQTGLAAQLCRYTVANQQLIINGCFVQFNAFVSHKNSYIYEKVEIYP